MDGAHGLSESTTEIDGGACSAERVSDGIAISDVGPDETELADLSQRLDDIGLPRIALRNADPDTPLEEGLADITANESAAAENRYKLFRSLDHGLAH